MSNPVSKRRSTGRRRLCAGLSFFVWFVFNAALAAAPSPAQPAPSPGGGAAQGRLILRVDPAPDQPIRWDAKSGVLTASGTVTLTDGEVTATAERLIYDSFANRAQLAGNVRLERGSAVLAGEAAEYDFARHEGRLTVARGQTQGPAVHGPVYFSGDEITTSVARTRITSGRLTTCEPDQSGYYLAGRTIEVYPGAKIVIEDVRFVDGGITLFYWPRLEIPLRQARPGGEDYVEIPRIGYGEEEGFFAKTGYHYFLSGDHHGRLGLESMSRLGTRVSLAQDYAGEGVGEGTVQASLLPNQTTEHLDWGAGWAGRLTAPGGYLAGTRSDWQIEWQDVVDPEAEGGPAPVTTASGRLGVNRHTAASTLQASINYKRLLGPVPSWEDRIFAAYDRQLNAEWRLHFDGSWLRRRTEKIAPQSLVGFAAQGVRRFGRYTLTLGGAQQVNAALTGDEPEPATWETVRRLPEIALSSEGTPVARRELPVNWSLSAGQYREEPSGTIADRLRGSLGWQSEVPVGARTSLLPRLGADADWYSTADRRFTLRSGLEWRYRPDPWMLWIGVRDRSISGRTPFAFDALDPERRATAGFAYGRGPLTWSLTGEYDLLAGKYEDAIAAAEYRPADGSQTFRLRTAYDIEAERFEYGAFAWEWQAAPELRLGVGAKYNVPNQRVDRTDAIVSWRMTGWEVSYTALFDGVEGTYERGELALVRDLGCRSLALRFDHRNQEVWFEYRITAFQPPGAAPSQQPAEPRLMFDPEGWRKLFE